MATKQLHLRVLPLTRQQEAALNLNLSEVARTVKRIVHHLSTGGRW